MSPSFGSRFRRSDEPETSAPRPAAGPGGDAQEGVVASDPTTAGGSGDDDWVAYELHEWVVEARVMLAQLVDAENIPHSWQGTTLLVPGVHEQTVDELVDEVDSVHDATIEPGDEVVGFEMTGWPADMQAQLVTRLGAAGVPHEIDGDGDLVVREDDEEIVELIIEDLLARTADEGLEELDGLDLNALLSDLFVACDRLRRDAHDADGVLAAVRHGQRLVRIATPYGFGAASWRSLRERTGELVSMLETGDCDDDELRSHAHELRDVLQRLV